MAFNHNFFCLFNLIKFNSLKKTKIQTVQIPIKFCIVQKSFAQLPTVKKLTKINFDNFS